ncbi:MAG: hypothetical protein ABI577_02035 [bacterium]
MTNLPEELTADTPVCVHHWVLSSPVGGTTAGLCRDCGAAKDFVESARPFALASRLRRK